MPRHSSGKDAPEPPDAITLSPYLGYGSLRPAIDLAHATGRGSSSSRSPPTRKAPRSNTHCSTGERGRACRRREQPRTTLTHAAAASSDRSGSSSGRPSATRSRLGLDLAGMGGPFLAPGVGAQGGTAESLRRVFGSALPNVLAASSREVLGAGPTVAALAARGRRDRRALAETLWLGDLRRYLTAASDGVLDSLTPGMTCADSSRGCRCTPRGASVGSVLDVVQKPDRGVTRWLCPN
jgi:orotidine-5'-phosphate decarboxylase